MEFGSMVTDDLTSHGNLYIMHTRLSEVVSEH